MSVLKQCKPSIQYAYIFRTLYWRGGLFIRNRLAGSNNSHRLQTERESDSIQVVVWVPGEEVGVGLELEFDAFTLGKIEPVVVVSNIPEPQ